jgi:ligand-binding sensor domain-containing protein
VNSIAVDPANTARLYVGTDIGVFVTTDGGTNWAVENTGFANVPVESLAINTINGVTSLYAFTHGRGVWRVAINNNGCDFKLSSRGQSFGVGGGSSSLQVTATPGGCPWQAESNEDWITINSTTNGAVNFTVAPNNSYYSRVGTIAIAGKSFIVTQSSALDNDTIAPRNDWLQRRRRPCDSGQPCPAPGHRP